VLWRALPGAESIVRDAWPEMASRYTDTEAEAEIATVQEVVTGVRRLRSDQGLKPGQKVAARLALAGSAVERQGPAIRPLLRLTEPSETFSATARLTVRGVTVEIDTAGAIDVAAERKRLEKDRAAELGR